MATKKTSTAKKRATTAPKKAAPKKAKAKAKASAKVAPRASAKKKTSPKRPYVAPKVSPLKGMSPDEWAKRLEGWQADAMTIIRALVTRHAPDATLAIKWGQPVWEHNGPFAWAKPSAKHLSLGFWRGSELPDPDGHLEGTGNRMRHVKIKSASDVDRLPIATYVQEAVALNDANGDPTKR